MASPPHPDPDIESLAAWRAGDEAAGERLVERHFDSVFRFFRTKVDADAEDLVQKAFMACLTRVDAIESFRAYLFGSARMVLLKHLRERYTRAKYAELAQLSIRDMTTPGHRLADRQEHALLLEAMQSLSLDAQVCIELFYWEEMSTAEIAAVLEVAPGTVKARLSRARAKLRDELTARMDAAPQEAAFETLLVDASASVPGHKPC
ncbi:MAG: sigma-70 family RNA polymerase sigma factor [Myxococcota bacterium]